MRVKKESAVTDFWQAHSLKYLEMALNTDRRERIHDPDGYGRHTGECGDTIEIFLKVHKDTVTNAAFDCDGCMNTAACANTVVHMAEGKRVDDAWEIATEDVTAFLETLPENDIHCAELAVGALYKALADYQKKRP